MGAFEGGLSAVRKQMMQHAHMLRALMERHPGLDPKKGRRCADGVCNQAGEDNRNVARMASLFWLVCRGRSLGETIDPCVPRGCLLWRSRAGGPGRQGMLHLAGGVRQMTRAYVVSKASKAYRTDARMHDSSFSAFCEPGDADVSVGQKPWAGQPRTWSSVPGWLGKIEDVVCTATAEEGCRCTREGYPDREIVPVTNMRRKQDDLIFDRDEFSDPNPASRGWPDLNRPSERMEVSRREMPPDSTTVRLHC